MHPFDLNLRHLRAVDAIVARGSMSAAAAAVNLSQPALTQGLAKLERLIGAALFERAPDGMHPTEAGTIFAERSAAAFGHLARATRGGRAFARPEHLMTSAQARGFLAFADHGSFVASAAATGLSQPAIHRAVRDLEQILGIPLVQRSGRTVVATPAGRKLATGLRLAAAEIAAAIADVRAEPATAIKVVVGAMPLCRARLLPQAIASCLDRAPGARFDVVEGSWRELVALTRDGTIDIMVGALRPPADVPDLDQRPLFEDRLVVVGRRDHPAASIAAADPAGLAHYPWIVGHAGSPLREQWEALFARTTRPETPVECGSVMTIRGLLLRGDFLTLLSPDQVGPELVGGVLARIGDPIAHGARTIGATVRAGWRPARLHSLFLAALEQAALQADSQEIL